jgi:hypothetical protein
MPGSALKIAVKLIMNDFKWSKTEKKIARIAFDKAYQRECSDLIEKIRKKVGEITEPNNIWGLHDYLTERRDDIDEKYDYRYSKLIFVFARLVKEGWLDFNDLKGLAENKIDRIESFINFWNE